jgi:hypothetical protein
MKVLNQQVQSGDIPKRFANDRHQALRVAWRIVHYWVKAQMAILETQMVKMEQIFLPYMIRSDGKTLFESMEKGDFKMLNAKIDTSTEAISGEIIENEDK